MSFFSLLLSLATNPHLLRSLAGLLILAGAWYLCTALGLRGNTRILIMAGVLLLVVVVQVLLTRRSRKKRERAATDLESSMILDADQTIAKAGVAQKRAREDARRELVAAIEVLKHSQLADGRGGRAALYVLPWYLVLGSGQTGKSALIRNSGLQAPDKGPGELRGIGASANCDWWFTNHAVVLEADQRFAASEGAKTADADWETFLMTLRKQRPRVSLNGVIITVSAAELLQGTAAESEAQARLLRRRLDEIGNELKLVFPVYLVVTKLDLVHGFEDYFAELGGAGGEQVFGCTLRAANLHGSDVERLIEAECDLLYQNLCRRCQMRLVQDEHKLRREGTYLFPLQMKHVADGLQRFAKVLCQSNAYGRNPLLRGFYFTSAGGEGQVIDSVRREMSGKLGLIAPTVGMAKPGSPLFLRGFFRNILVPDSDIARPTRGAAKRLWLVRRLIQVAVLAGLIAAGVAVAASFARNSKLVSETADLAATATRIPRRDSPALRDVDGALGQLDPLLQQLAVLDGGGAASGSWLNLGLYRGQKVRENARRVYLGRFVDLVLLPYQEALRDWLPQRALPEGQDDEFYKRYRVFRMLREPRHGVAPDMSEVMRQLYREEAGAGRDPAAEERLTRHVEFAIRYAEELQPLVTGGGGREGWDHEIDAKAERYIIDHWRIDTYYREVVGDVNSRRGEWAFNLDKLAAGSGTLRQRAPDSTDQPPTIPASFTRRGWDEEVGKILGDSEALRRDSWLLPEVVKQDLAGRYGQLVQLYAEDYVAHWRAFLESVILEAPGTLAEAENRLVDLAQGGSLYQQLLERAASDLSFDLGKGDGSPEVIAAMNRITSDFGSLHAALRRGEKGRRPLDEFLDSVMEVRKAVGEHKTGGHAEAAAAFTRGIFANDGPDRDSAIAKSLAAAEILAGSNSRSGDADCNRSLGAYLSQPALAAWQAYLNETQQYLDEKWQASVWTEFNALGGRYPLARMSTLDAPPEAFGVFFHDGGTLQSFVKQHLRPYVGDPGYAPKLVHGLGLQLTPDARKSLNAGLRLNQVLFANGESRPHCTFSVRPGQARVVPPAGLYVEKSIFRVGDQTLEYRQGQRTYKKFSWPPQEDAEVAEIKATLNQNASPCSLEMEPSFWALFRLMDAAAHAPEESMKFTLTWKVALKARPGSVVELPYEFIMEQNDHALLRGLTGVTCPEHLFY